MSDYRKMMYKIFLSVISGVCIAISLPGYTIFPAAFVAFVPLLFALENSSIQKSVAIAFVSGLTTGLIYYTWSIESSLQYSQSLSLKSIFVYAGLSIYHAAWFSLIGVIFYVAQKKFQHSAWKQILFFSSLVVVLEWCYQNIFPSYPWIIILPYTQSNNLLLLQWTSFGGMWILTFFVAGFNALLFFSLKFKNVKFIAAGITGVVCAHIAGYIFFVNAENPSSSAIKVVLLQENIDARERWSDTFVDSLARTLLHLNQQAAEQHPQLIVWSESAIPWTFQTDDDLLNEALNITYATGATHLVGTLTPIDNAGNVYNSLYCIEKDGKVTGRYDKQNLLSFLEKPFVRWQLPFVQSRYSNVQEGMRDNILQTHVASIGAMICNESLLPYASAKAAAQGAQLLVVASNDSWFYKSVLVDAHFALTRMRAIETRKDIFVNANRGFGGIIRSTGAVEILPPSDKPRIITCEVQKNSIKTAAAMFPDGLFYFSCVGILILLITHKQQ